MGRVSELSTKMRSGEVTVQPLSAASGQGRTERMRQQLLREGKQSRQTVRPVAETTRAAPAPSLTKAKREAPTATLNRAPVQRWENQVRQAQVDMNMEAILRLNRKLKEERARQGKQTLGDRASDVASAVFGGSGSSFTNLAGFASNLVQNPEADRRNIAQARKALQTGRTSDGRPINDAQRKTLEESISRLSASAEKLESPDSFTNRAYRAADRMADTGAAFQESAKRGLGKVGATVVDAAVSMGQSTLDSAIGAATGTGMLPFAARSLGGGTQEARRGGADLDQQLLYGSAQAAKEYVTEKLFGLSAPQRLIGGGSFDDAIEKGIRKATERLAKTPGGQKLVGGLMTWLAGGATEGLEEGIGSVIENALINPNLRDWDPDKRTVEEKISDGLYDMLVGGVSGLMGVTNLGQYQVSPAVRAQYAANRAEAARESTPAAERDVDAPSARKPAEAPQTAPRDVLTEAGQAAASPGDVSKLDTSPVRAGRVTTIQRPYQGVKPVQAQKSAAVVQVDPGSVRTAQNRINGARKLAADPMFAGQGFKSILKRNLQNAFRSAKGVPVEGVTFEGKPYLVDINRSALGKIISGSDLSAERLSLLDMLPDIVRNGEYIGSGEYTAHGSKAKPVSRYDYFETPVTINGQDYIAKFDVEALPDVNNFRTHQIVKIDLIQPEGRLARKSHAPASGESGPSGRTSSPGLDSTITQGAENVNPLGGDGLGAADAGFTTRGMEGQERTSRMAQSHPYNKAQEVATAMTKEEYNRLFRYQSQTEAKTTHLAEELVYVLQDGKKTFLKDVNEAQYNALLESLREATAWNAEQMEAARMILNELAGKSVNMDIVSEEYTNWMKDVREHETATGQGIQALAKWSRENKTGFASERDALRNLEKSGLSKEEQGKIYSRIAQMDGRINAVEAGDTAALKSIILETAADRGLIRGRRGELLSLWASKALDAMTFDQMKQFAFSSTAAMSSDVSKADLGQMVKTCQVLSMLSNKATVNRNLVGNASFYGVDALAMDGAALLDMAVSKATGTRSVAMERFALSPQALQDALRAAWISQAEVLLDVDMGGEKSRYGTGSNRTFKAGSKHATARFLSALERNQALFLTVPDEFFKGMARGNAAATQKLIDQGKIKTDNANYAAEQADALAKYRTFQDDTKIANAIQTVHDICNMLVGFGDSGRTIGGHKVHSFGMGDFVAAFTKVAGNLATRGVEYSPHNAVKGTLELVQQIHNAKTGKAVDAAKQARGVSNVARGLTGAAIACVFRGLIRAGVLRLADDDDDKNVAALNRSEGLDGVQLNLSAAYRWLRGEENTEPQTGDTLIDASSLEPINQLMYAAAYLEDGLSEVSAYPAAALSSAADLPVMDTVGNIGKRVYKYGEKIADVTAEELGRTAISSVIPNAIRAAARGLDDRSRNSSVNFDDVEEEDPVRRFLNIMLEAAGKQAMTSVPVLREKLPGGVSPTGEDKTYPTTQFWNLMNAAVNPLGVNTYTQTEQSKEWQRLREETGRTDFYPSSTIQKTIQGEGLEKKLSYEERQDFQRERGTWMMPITIQMMGNRGYQAADSERQSDLMADVRSFAHNAAKISVLGEDGVPKWVREAVRAQRETGLSPAAVIYYRDMLKREGKHKTSGEANSAVRNAIFKDSFLNTAQKNALDNLMITDGLYIVQNKDVDYSDEDSFYVTQLSDSAVKHWSLVHEKMPGLSGEQYGTAWEISNRKKPDGKAYPKAEKLRFLREELDLTAVEAKRLYGLMKERIEDE